MKTINVLVALAPAIAAAVVGFVVEVGPTLKKRAVAMMHSRTKVETLKELLAHTAFYGSFLGSVFGFKKDSVHTFYLAAVWFGVFLFLAFRLAKRVEELEEYEELRVHRKRAGLVRSIVRSELERVASSKVEKPDA